MTGRGLSRREVLRLVVVGSVASLAAACTGASAPPAPAPTAAPTPPPAKPAAAPTAASAAAPAPAAAVAPAAGDGAFQQLLDAARKETKLVIWVTTPNLEPTQRAVLEAFKKRFNLTFTDEWVPISGSEATTRLRTEAAAGRFSVDVGEAGLSNMRPLVDDKLLAKVDWMGLFGREMPAIKEANDRSIPEYTGLGLVHWDNSYVLAYNTEQIKPEEVPSSLEEFADPKWRGRFALNSTTVTPLDILGLEWGAEKAVDTGRKLHENMPLYKRGTPAVIVAVGQGEAPVGMGQISGTETEKAKGAPIAWKPLALIPVLPQFFYVPEGAPNPNLARLFIAWASTEGMPLQEDLERIGRITDPNSFVSKQIKTLAPNAKIVQERSLADNAQLVPIQEAIGKIRSGG